MLLFLLIFGFVCVSNTTAYFRAVLRKFQGEISFLHSNINDVSVDARTLECLDFQVILDHLVESAVTVQGKRIVTERAKKSATEANLAYSMVESLSYQLNVIPLRTSINVFSVLRQIESGMSPEIEELAEFSGVIEDIIELHEYFRNNEEKLNLFSDLTHQMALPKQLISSFDKAFDENGELNGEKFPIIGQLRRDVTLIRGRIMQIMQNLLRTNDMREKLADNGFEEMDGRFCLLLKNTYKKGVGIVHGLSNTGRTLYVEPMEVIEPTNEMKSILASIRAEENKILFEMCKVVSEYRQNIKDSVAAVAEIDVYRAKAILGQKLSGIIPEVGDEGVIRCIDARHPILTLRGATAVGNNIELNNTASSLVISGPNAGGKTIVLKTAGLFSLMSKHSIPLPTKFGARVDIFEVMADIGDMQTVSGDLSTFSGHLVVCREMLKKVHSRCEAHYLVLLDEIGTGTDPAQGAALAQAVLEDFVSADARVIVTTHYQRIKELAAEDGRFRIAAMEFVDNRPTYRLRVGSVGESYALEAGRRMNLPEQVLKRADSLLDGNTYFSYFILTIIITFNLTSTLLIFLQLFCTLDESRRLLALQKKLEEETEKARVKQAELDNKILELARQESLLAASKINLELEIEKVRAGKTDEFLKDIRAKERELQLLIRRVNDAVGSQKIFPKTSSVINEVIDIGEEDKNSTNHPLDKVGIDAVQKAVKNLRLETEKSVVQLAAEDIATPLVNGEPIEEGKTLIILEKGNLFGSRGIVTQRNKGRGRVSIRIAGVEVKMERHLLGIPLRSGVLGFADTMSRGADAEGLSAKERRLIKMLSEDLVDPDKLVLINRNRSTDRRVLDIRKSQQNTLDVRELQLTESQNVVTKFIERFIEDADEKLSIFYVNHGNSKSNDVIKSKIRSWLRSYPFVKKVSPANLSEGGDAFSIVELDAGDY